MLYSYILLLRINTSLKRLENGWDTDDIANKTKYEQIKPNMRRTCTDNPKVCDARIATDLTVAVAACCTANRPPQLSPATFRASYTTGSRTEHGAGRIAGSTTPAGQYSLLAVQEICQVSAAPVLLRRIRNQYLEENRATSASGQKADAPRKRK